MLIKMLFFFLRRKKKHKNHVIHLASIFMAFSFIAQQPPASIRSPTIPSFCQGQISDILWSSILWRWPYNSGFVWLVFYTIFSTHIRFLMALMRVDKLCFAQQRHLIRRIIISRIDNFYVVMLQIYYRCPIQHKIFYGAREVEHHKSIRICEKGKEQERVRKRKEMGGRKGRAILK